MCSVWHAGYAHPRLVISVCLWGADLQLHVNLPIVLAQLCCEPSPCLNVYMWVCVFLTNIPLSKRVIKCVYECVCVCFVQEADGFNIRWEASSGKPGLQDIYLNLMPRLFAISKGVPFMIQGAGQANLVNWGDGFVTDSAAIQTYGLSDPNNFFTALMRTDLVYQACPAMLTLPPPLNPLPAGGPPPFFCIYTLSHLTC